MKQNTSSCFEKLLPLIAFLFSYSILQAQTPTQRRVITQDYDHNKLQVMAQQFAATASAKKREAQALAQIHGWELIKYNEDGTFDELMAVTDDGRPIYYTLYNVDAARSTRTDHLNTGGSLGLDLNGQGMTVHVWDGGPTRPTHQEFDGPGASDRVTINDGITTLNWNSWHAQHVTGTIVASGVRSNAKGMALQARALTHDWNNDLSEATTAAAAGMLLSNHSYGIPWRTETGEVFLPSWYGGAYVNQSRRWDNLMYNAPFYLMVVAAGNDGNDNSANSDPLEGNSAFDKLTGNATAKNNLVVANAQDASIGVNGSLTSVSIYSGSSEGPTDDFRIKPDIAGNGTGVHSTTHTGDADYRTATGTSMAAPNVTGTLLLLQQHHHNLNGTFMRAATLKGLALHTADDAGMAGPDAVFGWGLLNAKAAAQEISANGVTSIIAELTLNPGQSYSLLVEADGVNDLMASISWTDPPGIATTGETPNITTPVLVNDLDIRVSQNANTFLPYRLTGVNTNNQQDNEVDPFERIDVEGATGSYTITVTHKGSLSGGSQDYSLIVTGVSNVCNETIATPANLNVSAVRVNTSTVSWDAVQNSTYNIRYREEGSATWTNVSTSNTSVALTDLNSSTQYEVQVRSICLDNSTSDYSASVYFTTGALTDFITTWQTTEGEKSITIPTTGEGYNYNIDWGDGETDTGENGDITHIYATAGEQIIKISGDFPRIYFNNNGDAAKLLKVEQWGDIQWTSMEQAFAGCGNLEITATDVPDLSDVTNLSGMFNGAISFNQDISGWDVNSVTHMNSMFAGATSFNQNIGSWNVSSVTQMNNMFKGATSFNQDIGGWVVSNVNIMRGMFEGATSFNQNIGNWNVSNVTEMSGMFMNATSFNQDLGSWTSNATERTSMFDGSGLHCINYSATLIGWAANTPASVTVTLGASGIAYGSHATDARNALESQGWTITDDGLNTGTGCGGPGPFITTWKTKVAQEEITIPINSSNGSYDYTVDWGDGSADTGQNGDAKHTYESSGTYRVEITGDFPGIYFNNGDQKDKITEVRQWGNIQWKSMEGAFAGCTNLEILATDAPDLSAVTNMSRMFFQASKFNQDIGDWDVSNVTQMNSTFAGATSFNQPIGSWNVSSVTQMNNTFAGATSFNQDIGGWVVSNVNIIRGMFEGATSFNQPIGDWDMSNVTNMNGMFIGATSFNQDIGGWVVSNVNIMRSMFSGATSFNQDIGDWDVSNVTQMNSTFAGATSFNQDIGGWVVSNVNIMRNMFEGATSFNQPIGDWDVSNVTNMNGMFAGATSFNQDISGWDVSKVTHMGLVFFGATSFNQDISDWDVSKVTGMAGMFGGATTFNQDISDWDVSSVTAMRSMFSGATSFNQNLGSWESNAINRVDMFNNSGLDCSNYSATLIGWANNTTTENVTLGASGRTYGSHATDARTVLENRGWRITGDGLNTGTDCIPPTPFITTWRTTGHNEGITIPTNRSSINGFPDGYDYTVDWGDGTVEAGWTGDANHTYAIAGEYKVKITGDFPAIHFNGGNQKDKIIKVNQWGTMEWKSMLRAFRGCTKLEITAKDVPDLSKVTEMSAMFDGATLFNQDISGWDVSQVTRMNSMFGYATSFNQNLGSWTSNATNRTDMFNNSGLDCSNYSATLIGWANNTDAVNVPLGAIGMEYGTNASEAVTALTNRGWNILGHNPSGGECLLFTIDPIDDATVNENTTYTGPVPSLSGNTPMGTVTYTLGGTDAALFTIDPTTGQVSMGARDFEVPEDANTDNVYELSITATDDDANSAGEDWRVTIRDVNEAVTVTFTIDPIDDAAINENMAYTGPLPSLSGDTPIGNVTYTLGGTDANWFTINSSTGRVRMIARDFEGPVDANTDNVYELSIIATDDDSNSANEDWRVTVLDVNEVATFTIDAIADVTIDENTAYTGPVPALSGTPIGNVTFSLGGTDANRFTIDLTTGQVSMEARDYETPEDANSDNVYELSIAATDDDANSAGEDWQVTIEDVKELVTGVIPSNVEDVRVYPIPAEGQLNIALDSTHGKIKQIVILMVSGQVLSSQAVSQGDLTDEGILFVDVSNLAAGLYLLEVQGTETSSIFTTKFFKQ